MARSSFAMLEDMTVRNLSPATHNIPQCGINARPGHGAGAHHRRVSRTKLPVVLSATGRALPGGNPEPQKPHRADHERVLKSFS